MPNILRKMSEMWGSEGPPTDAITPLHFRYLERFGHPPGYSFVECRGLDARGLPKFRVPAERRAPE
ncbi:MAG: hypothetical protein RLZZ129_751 [Verrucomicrobiota bacterium]|jgi:hypothetical protein